MKIFIKNIKYLQQKDEIINKFFNENVINIEEISLKNTIKISELSGYSVNDLLKKDIVKIGDLKQNFDFKFLVTDIDGVLTDGGMYYSQDGNELKRFNAKDGIAIKHLVRDGYKVGFLSSGINGTIINNRAELLDVQYVYIGTWKKLEKLQEWCNEQNITLENVAYIGDDVNDLEVIKSVGLSACPADAVDKIKAEADIILTKKGGEACLREFIDNYLR